jgi:hypothetical protein
MLLYIFLIWLLGALLAYFRVIASTQERMKHYKNMTVDKMYMELFTNSSFITLVLLSWLGFVWGFVYWYVCDEKYFLKLKLKKKDD